MKKLVSILLATTMIFGLTACSSSSTSTEGGEIYFLNFKPEIAEVYNEIAAVYEAETGVKLNVVTAASGTYEQTLKSEIAKAEAPTIFQVNGPRGYANWKDYTADLSGTELYKALNDSTLALTDGDKVVGIPYVVEGYGIIYNNAIMDKYFALPNRTAAPASMEEVNNFATLSAVVEEMTARQDELGIQGVFASTSLKPGEDWRWQTHLMNFPVYYEFLANSVDLTSDDTKTMNFQFSDNFKNIFDLYINNSVTDSKLLGSKQVGDSMAEFALGQVAMVQNGNWAWGQISDVAGNTVAAEDIKFLPIYTGVEGEETQGISVGTENYFCINGQASEEQQQLAADFLYWLYSSDAGKDFVVNKLGFIAPFNTFGEDEKPADPLAKEVIRWMEKDGIVSVPWNFTLFPSQQWKDNFGAGLLQYAQGTKAWDVVVADSVTDWSAESGK